MPRLESVKNSMIGDGVTDKMATEHLADNNSIAIVINESIMDLVDAVKGLGDKVEGVDKTLNSMEGEINSITNAIQQEAI